MDEIINLTLSQDQITARFKNSTKNFSRILMVSEHSRKAKCCMDLSLWLPPANFKTNQTFWGGGGMRTRKIGLQTLYRSGWGETVQKPALTSQRSLRNTGIHNRERIGQNSKSQMHFFWRQTRLLQWKLHSSPWPMHNSVGGYKKIVHEWRLCFNREHSGHKVERYRNRGSLKCMYTRMW